MEENNFLIDDLLNKASTGQYKTLIPALDLESNPVAGDLGFDYLNQYDKGLLRGMNQMENRALNQNDWKALGIGISKALINGVGEFLATPGYTVAALDLFSKNESDFSNAWTEFFGEGSKELASNLVGDIYQTQDTQEAIFDPLNLEWWANTAEQLGPTIGLMAASYFTAGVATPAILNTLGKAGKAGQYLNKARQTLQANKKLNNFTNSAIAASTSRIAESTMEAHQAYEEAYNNLINKGIEHEEAKLSASKAARNTYLNNLPLVVMDFLEFDLLFKNFGKAGFLGKLATESGLEGLEEVVQFGINSNAQNKAEIFAGLNEDETSILNEIMNNLDNPELQKSFVQGAVGGAIFTGGGKALQKGYKALRDRNRQVVDNSKNPEDAVNETLLDKPKDFLNRVKSKAQNIINDFNKTEDEIEAEQLKEIAKTLSDKADILLEAQKELDNTKDIDPSENTVIEDAKDAVNENENEIRGENIKYTAFYKKYKKLGISIKKNESYSSYVDRVLDIEITLVDDVKMNALKSYDTDKKAKELSKKELTLQEELIAHYTNNKSSNPTASSASLINSAVIKKAKGTKYSKQIQSKYNKLNELNLEVETNDFIPSHIKPKFDKFIDELVANENKQFELEEQNKLSEANKIKQAEQQLREEKKSQLEALKLAIEVLPTPSELKVDLDNTLDNLSDDVKLSSDDISNAYEEVAANKLSEQKRLFKTIDNTDLEQVEDYLEKNQFYTEHYLDKYRQITKNDLATVQDLAKAIVKGAIKSTSNTETEVTKDNEISEETISYTKEDYISEVKQGKQTNTANSIDNDNQDGDLNNYEDGVFFKYKNGQLELYGGIRYDVRPDFKEQILKNLKDYIIYETEEFKPLLTSSLQSVRSINSQLEVNKNNEIAKYFNYNKDAINNLKERDVLTIRVQQNDFTSKADMTNLPLEIVNSNGDIVGMVKTLDYRIDERKQEQLKKIRTDLFNSQDSTIQVKVTKLYTGRYNNTPVFNDIDQLGDVPIGVTVRESNGVTKIVHTDTTETLVHPSNPTVGAIYAYIKNNKGNYDAVRLFTKQVKDTKYYQKLQELIFEFSTKPDNKDLRRQILDIVRFKNPEGKYLPDSINEKGIELYTNYNNEREYNIDDVVNYEGKVYRITSLKENTARVEELDSNLKSTDGQILELEFSNLSKHWVQSYIDQYKLDEKVLQIDYKKLQDSTYVDSIKDRLETNINPTEPFYGIKFKYEYNRFIGARIPADKINTKEAYEAVSKFRPVKNKSRFDRKSKTNETTRFKVVDNINYDQSTIEEELAYFNKVLPNVPIYVLDSVKAMKDKFGKNAYGSFYNSAVYITQSPIKGVAAHEAFEVVYSTLDTKQQNKLLRWVKKNRTEDYKHDDIDFIADSFMDYVNDIKPKSLTQSIRNIFDRILEFINILFNQPLSARQLFNKINRSGFSNIQNLPNSDVRFKRTELPPLLEQQIIDVATRHIQKEVNKYLKNNNLDNTDKNLVKAYKFFINPNKEDILTTESEYYENDYIPFIDVLSEAYKNSKHPNINDYLNITFDSLLEDKILYNKIIQSLYKKGINITFTDTRKSDMLDEDDYNVETLESNQLESWQVKTQINPFDKVSAKLRNYLDSVYIISHLDNGTPIHKVDDVFGYKYTFDGYNLFKKLSNILANTYNIQDIIPKLEKVLQYDKSIYYVVKDLKEDQSLLKEFFKGIVNFKEKGKIAIQEVETKYTQDGKPYRTSRVNLIDINRNTLVSNIVDKMYSGFINKLDLEGNYKSNYKLDLPNNVVKANTVNVKQALSDLTNNGLTLPDTITAEELIINQKYIKAFLESSNPFETEIPTKLAQALKHHYDLYQDSYTKSSGKGGTVQAYRAGNYIRKFASKIRDGSLFNNNPIYSNLNNLFVKNLKNNKKLAKEFEVVELTEFKPASKNKAVSYNDFSDYDSYMMIIGSFISNGVNNNAIHIPLSVYSDAPTLNGVRVNKLTKEQALDYLQSVYLDEVLSIVKHIKNIITKDVTDGKKFDSLRSSNIEELGVDGDLKLTKGEIFYLFPYMNNKLRKTPKTLDELIKYGNYLESLDIRPLADKFLQKEYNKVLSKLKELEIINEDNSSDIIQSKQPTELVEEVVYNLVAYQSSIIPITQGDLAYYKDIADFFKRAKEIYSPGQYNQYLENEQQYRFNELLILEDPVESSNVLESISEYSDNIKRFEEFDTSADAQSFIDLLAYKKRLIGDNRWNSELQLEYEKMLRLEDSNLDIEVIKPFYYNLEHSSVRGTYPLQLKTSEFVWTPKLANLYGDANIINMFKQMGYNTESGKVLPTTEEELISNRKIDQVIFTSGVKAEQFNVVPYKEGKHDYSNKESLKIDLTEWRRQQETPIHHKDYESTFGTQTMKLIIGDIDYNKDYNGKTGKQLLLEYNDLIVNDIKRSYESIVNKFDNIESLVETLREEVIARGLGDQYLEALEMTYNEALDFNNNYQLNDTKLPLWHPLHAYRVQAIANSIFKNNITKQKLLRGVALINQSDYGFKKRPEIKFNENGIEYYEAYAPIYSEELLDTRHLTDGLPDISKIEQLNPDLLKGIVYRIPTEDKYSMFQIKIIGFLPNSASIVLPKEAPIIAGLDFDIDKVFGFFRHSNPDNIDTQNNPNVAQYYNDNRDKIISDNAKFDIMYSILQNSPKNQLNGGNYDTIGKVIEKDILPNIKVDKIDNYSSMSTMVDIIRRMNMGKALIGPAANFNAMHSQWQHSSLFTDEELTLQYSIKFNDNIYNKLSSSLDTNGRLVTQNIAEQLAAVVDNGKDPKAEFFNLNLYTTDVFNTMLAIGVPLREAMLFIAQPKIKQFVQDYYNLGGNFQAEDKVMKSYGVNNIKINSEVNNFTTEQLLDGIKNNTNQDELLKAFVVYKKIAQNVSDFLRASKMGDSSAGPTIIDNQLNINAVSKESSIEGGGAYLKSNQFMNKIFEYGIKFPQEVLVNKLGLPKINSISSSWNYLYEYFTQLKNGYGLTAKEYNTILNGAYHYLATQFDYFSTEDFTKIINNTHNLLSKVKESNSKYSLFLDQLHISQDNIIQWRKPLDKYEMDTMRELWYDMLVSGNELEQSLGNALIKYSFYNSGFSVKPNSFSHMQPVGFFTDLSTEQGHFNEIMKLGLSEFNSYSPRNINGFIDQYIRNNYKTIQLPRAVLSEKEQNVSVEFISNTPVSFKPLESNYSEFMSGENILAYSKLTYQGRQYLGRFQEGRYVVIQQLGNDVFKEYSYSTPYLDSIINEKVQEAQSESKPKKIIFTQDQINVMNEALGEESKVNLEQLNNASSDQKLRALEYYNKCIKK